MEATHRHAKAVEKSKSELEKESDNLRDELQVALLAAEDIRALRVKSTLLIERLRDEKEARLKLQAKNELVNRKLEMMADHMEKLMNHLRIEAKQKHKIIDNRTQISKQLQEARLVCEKQQKIIESKNRLEYLFVCSHSSIFYCINCRYIAEVCEGSKLLEDQLRLMDEKYLEMRKKLDYAREVNRIEVVKAQKEASGLRRKFATLTGSTRLLDTVQDARQLYGQPVTSLDQQRAVSWADFPHSPGNNIYGPETPNNGGMNYAPAPGKASRAQSAPSKRSDKNNQKQSQLSNVFDAPTPTLDSVLHKIEVKRRTQENHWDVDRAKELLAETEEAYRPKSGKPPKLKDEKDHDGNGIAHGSPNSGMKRGESNPSILSQVKFKASLINPESPETNHSVVFEESSRPHSNANNPNIKSKFGILGRGNMA